MRQQQPHDLGAAVLGGGDQRRVVEAVGVAPVDRRAALEQQPGLVGVALPGAHVERLAESGLVDQRRWLLDDDGRHDEAEREAAASTPRFHDRHKQRRAGMQCRRQRERGKGVRERES